MRSFLPTTLCGLALLLASSPSPAALGFNAEQVVDQAVVFTRDRVQDGRTLIEGPRAPAEGAIPSEWSCEQMYNRRVALSGRMNDYKPTYWDDPRNRAAVFIGTVFTPAFYFLAYTGLTEYLDTARGRGNETQAEIHALQQGMAAQQCFLR